MTMMTMTVRKPHLHLDHLQFQRPTCTRKKNFVHGRGARPKEKKHTGDELHPAKVGRKEQAERLVDHLPKWRTEDASD
jgi:hypothetical protein